MSDEQKQAAKDATVALRQMTYEERGFHDQALKEVLDSWEQWWAGKGVSCDGAMARVWLAVLQDRGFIPEHVTRSEQRMLGVLPCWGGFILECRNPKGFTQEQIRTEIEWAGGSLSLRQIGRILRNDGSFKRAAFNLVQDAIDRLEKKGVQFSVGQTVRIQMEEVLGGWKATTPDLRVEPIVLDTYRKAMVQMQAAVASYLTDQMNV